MPDKRRAVRQEEIRPVTEGPAPWLREQLALISQKTRLAEVIRDVLSRWDGLTRFIDDGRIEIDSSTVERSIQPIALNGKRSLRRLRRRIRAMGDIASLIEPAKLNDVEPLSYLGDVLTKIVNGHPNSIFGSSITLGLVAAQLSAFDLH